jgi:hypothetical protein
MIAGMNKRDRNLEMLRLVLEGRSCREVGEMFGLTRNRVLVIVKQLDPAAARKGALRKYQNRHRPEVKKEA